MAARPARSTLRDDLGLDPGTRLAELEQDPALLCFALSARYQQTFATAGLAGAREAIVAEIIALAMDAELPTFEIQGQLIRMQALWALYDLDAASREADSYRGSCRPLRPAIGDGLYRLVPVDLPDGDFGPYEPCMRPLARAGRLMEARAALDTLPEPPRDLLFEVSWSLIGVAAAECGHPAMARCARSALLPADGERAAGSGVVDLGPIRLMLAAQ